MKINFKVRFNNPMFYIKLVIAILTPALAYLGLESASITTWGALGSLITEAYSNPYLLGLILASVYNATIDSTTSGFSDSDLAMTYDKPKKKTNKNIVR